MYKFHRLNTDFQIEHFLMGKAHTPDGKYFVLRELEEERANAVRSFDIKRKKIEAQKLRLRNTIGSQSTNTPERMEAEADLEAINSGEQQSRILYEAAKAELATIRSLIERIKPQCKFADKDEAEASQLAQRDEWRLELIFRAQNYMVTQGSIPQDHFATMRCHPDFKTHILPAIEDVIASMRSGRMKLLEKIAQPVSAIEEKS